MNNYALTVKRVVLAGLCFAPSLGFAIDSGSTGADGAFNPTVNTVLAVPASGVFNFTTVNIPAGVVVTFTPNTANKPVTILASGNVTISGYLGVNGYNATPAGASGGGALGDDGIPGIGGPGGYSGGRGGQPGNRRGGSGLGPGAGDGGGGHATEVTYIWGGHGAGYAAKGGLNRGYPSGYNESYNNADGAGVIYGTSLLLPLVGGSGGGGGYGGTAFNGSGGGGGGGAILIASSGTVTVNTTGTIAANGGGGGESSGSGSGAAGGGGSGGAIRIVATAIAGNGTITAVGGGAGNQPTHYYSSGGDGAVGRIRIEAETMTRTAASTPVHSFGAPGPLAIGNAPSLVISSIAGVQTPANPTGNADINLPANTVNPVTVVFNTTGVPVGNTVKLTVTPSNAKPIYVTSPALSGTTESATASVSVTLPAGPSVLSATMTYTLIASLGMDMSNYAMGERVEKVRLSAVVGGKSSATLITVSGKEYAAPGAAMAMLGLNG